MTTGRRLGVFSWALALAALLGLGGVVGLPEAEGSEAFATDADCGACGICNSSYVCLPKASGTVCREAAGACDTPEVCNGSSFVCPALQVTSCSPFKCYEIKPSGYTPDDDVIIDDELYTLKHWDAQRPWNLCAPATVGRIERATLNSSSEAHLEGYSVKLTPTSPPQVPPPPVELQVTDQFGTVTGFTDKAFRVLVPTSKSFGGYVPPPPPTALDNYLCYTFKLKQEFKQINNVVLNDQFTVNKVYNLAQPYNVCVPASVQDSIIPFPNAYYLCYKVLRVNKQGDFVTTNGLYLDNIFGPHRANTEKEEDLCMPATIEVDTP